MRRSFSLKERIALFLSSNGRCESCGCALENGWHADHAHPFSKGGATDVLNGRATCPKCNLMKGAKVMSKVEFRDWQHEAIKKAMEKFESGEKTFVAAAGVGSGKTIFGLGLADRLIAEDKIDQVVIVSPSGTVQIAWATDFERYFGRSIRACDGNADLTAGIPSDKIGYSTTYQSVDASPELHKLLALKRGTYGVLRRTLLIIDEAHHIGIDERGNPTTWAKSVQSAFEDCSYFLVLSGTPERSDKNKIPFVTYENDQAVFDIEYGYGKAVNAGIVRRTSFRPVEASGLVEIAHDLAERISVNEPRSRARSAVEKNALNVFPVGVDPEHAEVGVAAERIIDVAIHELDQVAKSHPRAAMLCVCDNIAHAHYVEQLLIARGISSVVVHSKMKDAQKQIEIFRRSTVQAIISIGMISEGVSINRLRVLSFLTRKMTTLYLNQIMGRVVRLDWQDNECADRGEVREIDDVTGEDLPPGNAIFVHLNKPEIVEWSEKVEDEIQANARADEIDEKEEEDKEKIPGEGPELWPELAVSDVQADELGEVVASFNFGKDVVELASKLRAKVPKATRLMSNQMAQIALEELGEIKSTESENKQDKDSFVSSKQREKQYRDVAAKLVGRLSKTSGVDYGYIHAAANRRVGIPSVRHASLEQHGQKCEVLQDWLKNGLPRNVGEIHD